MALSPGLTSASLRATQPSDAVLLPALRRLVCAVPQFWPPPISTGTRPTKYAFITCFKQDGCIEGDAPFTLSRDCAFNMRLAKVSATDL